MRIVVFDLETRRGPDDLSPGNLDYGFQLLAAGEGGISALCLYDLSEEWLYLYDDNDLSVRAAVSHLESADVVVGYRSVAFDLPCVEGIVGRRLRIRSHLDLYRLMAQANAFKGYTAKRGESTLDAVCKRTFGRGKNGAGGFAPELARLGRFGELFNYCGQDVRLTRDLLLHIARHGTVSNPSGRLLQLDIPENIRQALNVRNQLPDRTTGRG